MTDDYVVISHRLSVTSPSSQTASGFFVCGGARLAPLFSPRSLRLPTGRAVQDSPPPEHDGIETTLRQRSPRIQVPGLAQRSHRQPQLTSSFKTRFDCV